MPSAIIISALMDGATVLDPERYFCDHGFTVRMDDTTVAMRNKVFSGRLMSAKIDLGFEVSCIFWGTKAGETKGQIALANADRELDVLGEVGMQDRSIEVRVGNVDQHWSDWEIEFKGVINSSASFSGDEVVLEVANIANRLERVFNSATYATGDASIIGENVPRAVGNAYNVPALLINRTTPTYATGGNTQLVRSNGVELVPTTQWTAIANGFDLLVAPSGRITADVQGVDSVVNGLDSETLAGFVETILELAGLDPGNRAGMSALESLNYTLGFWAQKPVTLESIMDQLAASYGGYWFFDNDKNLRIQRLEAPSSPVFEINEFFFELGKKIEREPDDKPGYSGTCAGRRNWHVNTPNEIANSLTSPYLQIAADLQRDYRFRRSGVAPGTPPPPDLSVENTKFEGVKVNQSSGGIGSLFQEASDCQSEATRWRALYSVRRNFYYLPLVDRRDTSAQIRSLRPGQTVAVTAPLEGEKRPFGLVAKNLVVVGLKRQRENQSILLKVWG